jgi:hypothetical protein
MSVSIRKAKLLLRVYRNQIRPGSAEGNKLEKAGLVQRIVDFDDKEYLALSPEGVAALEQAVNDARRFGV